MNTYMDANRAMWDELAPLHTRSTFYGVDDFRAGKSSLLPIEREEVGDVSGKTFLHLQCHFGLDTLSWARLGAQVTGADFSAQAIELARSLSREVGIDARFVCANLYDLPQHLAGAFDIVFTSGGVLPWLPDLRGWAQVIAHFVRPGGMFYIIEDHPIAGIFQNERPTARLEVAYPYFPQEEPMRFEPQGSYAAPNATVTHPSYEWSHSLGEIMGSLLSAGLVVEYLHEFPLCGWERFPQMMEQGEDGYWRLKEPHNVIPLSFSLKAHKPMRVD